MAYYLNGVTVDVSRQAVRPREAGRLPVAVALASPEMASRAPRPRESTPPSALTAALLQKVTQLKGQQVASEKKLAAVGADLRSANGAVQAAQAQNNRPAVAAATAKVVAVQRVADTTITQIRAIAAAANDAAAGAIQAGATRAQVDAAAAKAMPGITSVVPGLVNVRELPATFTGQPALAPTTMVYEGPRNRVTISQPGSTSSGTVGPSSGNNLAIESNNAGIAPNGQLVVGPDATAIATPALTEPGSGAGQQLQAQDVTVSSGSLGTLALAGIAGWLGYKFLKKRGIL